MDTIALQSLGSSKDIRKEQSMNDHTQNVTIEVEFTDAQARHLAQFLKRVGFSEFLKHAQSEDEAYAMSDAVRQVRAALAASGYAVR